MAKVYRKKKRDQGLNKNEEKVQRALDAQNQKGARLGDKFPSVKRLTIHLVFLSAQQQVLDEKTWTLGPQDNCVAKVSCPGRCGTGSFDFTAKIAQTITAAAPQAQCSAKCPNPLYAGSQLICGCEIKCNLEIEYFPVQKDEPLPAQKENRQPQNTRVRSLFIGSKKASWHADAS